MGLELCLVDSESSGLCPVDFGKSRVSHHT
jgi:hypothetical protein